MSRNLVATRDYGEIADCDWVLEAATEDLGLKRRIFARIEEVVRPDALITSNTSSLPASRLFDRLEHKGRQSPIPSPRRFAIRREIDTVAGDYVHA